MRGKMTDPTDTTSTPVVLTGWRRCRCGLCLYVWEEPTRGGASGRYPSCGRTEELSEERRVG